MQSNSMGRRVSAFWRPGVVGGRSMSRQRGEGGQTTILHHSALSPSVLKPAVTQPLGTTCFFSSRTVCSNVQYTFLRQHFMRAAACVCAVASFCSNLRPAPSCLFFSFFPFFFIMPQTVRFKNELERNITIKLGYANAKIFKAVEGAVPGPGNFRSVRWFQHMMILL